MKYITMKYHKLTTNPDSTNIEYIESPTMVEESNVPEGLDISNIKTVYGELIYSWPVEPEGFEEEYFGTNHLMKTSIMRRSKTLSAAGV